MLKVLAIKLPDEFNNYKNTNEDSIDFLEPVSKINIFVGSNNSGKSRFMRMLSSMKHYDVKQNDFDLDSINSDLQVVVNNFNDFLDLYDLGKVNNNLDREVLKSFRSVLDNLITLGYDRFGQFRHIFKSLATNSFSRLDTRNGGQIISGSGNAQRIQDEKKEISDRAVKLLNSIPIFDEKNAPKKVYIPTLRGLRPLDDNHSDLYSERTKQDYFKEKDASPEIFSGLSLYQRLIDLLLGTNKERKLITDYQEFISKTLFEGKSVALIPNPREKVVVVKIGNEQEQPIHHLGDGIQSAIILSFLPFVMQEQTFFFIEEPEMYLHPGLQRKLLDFYNSPECKKHMFFMTTHSNHFLDITIDIKEASIFTFRKVLDDSEDDELTPNFTIENVDSGHESSLELLGVRNSSVFLVNATIWVEGITDRWYLRKMLNSYMEHLKESDRLDKKLEEDTHYSFVEYGGGNITHWSFLENYEDHPIEVKRLCAKATVIIDKDGEKKTTRKEALEKILGERLIILACREVENLLPYKIIKDVVLEYEKDPKLVIKDYDYSKYQDIYLGKFIEETMLKKSFTRKGGYKGDSGTIKDKVSFCKKALKKITYEDLPESTKEVIQSIYKFILSQNS
jgi:predicted ATPase